MTKILKAANWGLDRIIDGTGFLGIALMISLSLFVVLVMMSRHVIAVNIPGFFDAAMYVLIVFPLFTATFTLRSGQHITVDILVKDLPERAQVVLRIITYLTSLVFVFVMFWQATKWWSSLFSSGLLTAGVWLIPKWILIAFFAFGSLLLIPQIIRIMAKDFYFLTSNKESNPISLQGFLVIAGFVIGFAGAVYMFAEGNKVAATLLLLGVVLFSGMPVFLGLGVLATVGLYFGVGPQGLIQEPQIVFTSLRSFPLTCLPLFIFAGIVMERGKLVDDLFKFVEVWIGRFTPSLLLVTIIVGMLIASLTGSTTAASAMLAATAIPILARRGFKMSLNCGLVAASASGSLIPPSLGYVVYCVLVEESISEMFIASLLPAIMIFAMFILYILLINTFSKKSLFEGGQIPSPPPESSVSWRQRLVLTGKALPVLFAPILVLGSIYLGIFTPTESAAALLVYSIILTVFVRKTVNWKELYQSFSRGTVVSSMILCILTTAFIFGRVISQIRVVDIINNFAVNIGLGPTGVIVFIFVTLLILGMIMNAGPIKPITLPIFYPMAIAVGINPIWLGVFYQINNEFATMTPPFGIDFFVVKSLLGVPYGVALKGFLPFIMLFILSLVIITMFPEIVLWLPSTM